MDHRERIDAKVGILFQIADQYVSGQMSLEQAKESVGFEMVHIRPAQVEAMKTQLGQRLKEVDQANAKKLFELFQPYLSPPFHKLQDGHPLKNYFEENGRVRTYLLTLDQMEGDLVTQEDWKQIYLLLSAFRVHIERQEKNFYPRLISMGLRLQVEKAKALGTDILDGLEKNQARLRNGELFEFLYQQRSLSQSFMDYMDLEERVLFGKALTGFTVQEFAELRILDDEAGYAYIETPVEFAPQDEKKASLSDGSLEKAESVTGGKSQTDSTNLELILPALLAAKEMGAVYYSLSGAILSVLGNQMKERDLPLAEELRQSLIKGNEAKKKFLIKDGKQASLITYSLVRDSQGNCQGILKTKENLDGVSELPDARTIDSSQNIVELFKMYPKFQEDFYEMDEDLKGLRGSFGMEILTETSVGMLAKSLRMDTAELVDRINDLLKSY